MKSASISIAPSSSKRVLMPPNEGGLLDKPEMLEVIGKMRRYEIFPPKFRHALKENAKWDVLAMMEHAPNTSLKVALSAILSDLPDGLPPVLVLEVLEVAANEWQIHHKKFPLEVGKLHPSIQD